MLGALYVISDLIFKIALRGRNITVPILQVKKIEVKRELNNFQCHTPPHSPDCYAG